jgi:cytochrome c biogenesis protein
MDAAKAVDAGADRAAADSAESADPADATIEGAEPLEATTLSTQPEPPRLPGLGWRELARWAWRQLTSMRTALFLLFLLALGAVPGSVFPQRGNNSGDVLTYLSEHPKLGPLLDKLGLFDVFGSAWFAAVYLLLFVSLAGCVIPRSFVHWRAMRAQPPAAPRNLTRLPEHRTYVTDSPPEDVLAAARASLRARRWRLADGAGAVSAEKGYARETGNLVFHLALIVLLVGVALGSLFGTKGSVIVVDGAGFANTLTRFDSFTAGSAANVDNLPPFSFVMTKFKATYERGGPQDGAPRSFAADLLVRDTPTSPQRKVTIEVNKPLTIGGTKVFLIGHGYAPVVTVRDGTGRVVLSGPVPFLPRDGKFLSQGVIKAADARPTQFGFRGLFLPTAAIDPLRGGISTYPAADSPALLLTLFSGDLGEDDGVSQSVYQLDTTKMKQAGAEGMRIGDTWLLPNKLGSISFDGYKEFASFSVAHDPGKDPVFFAAMTALAGLMMSLFVRRRRIWVRATEQADGRTLVAVGGLAKTEAGGLGREVDDLMGELRVAAPEHEPKHEHAEHAESPEEPQ